MKTVAIVQARLGSSRLPGKVLREINGQPMLAHVLTRIQQSNEVDEVVVATSHARSDRRLWDWCRVREYPCFCGEEADVLSRYRFVAAEVAADVIVRITADCPLVDAELVDRTVGIMRTTPGADLVSTVWPQRTFPRGLDVEVLRREALERLHLGVKEMELREHVTLGAYRGVIACRTIGVRHQRDRSAWRLTVDTIEDHRVVDGICRQFEIRTGHPWGPRSWAELEPVLAANPDWMAGNRHVQQKVA